jgi:hypothetical protein
MRVDGHIRGYVSGVVDADFNGVLHGTINASVESGAVQAEDQFLLTGGQPHIEKEDSHETTAE